MKKTMIVTVQTTKGTITYINAASSEAPKFTQAVAKIIEIIPDNEINKIDFIFFI